MFTENMTADQILEIYKDDVEKLAKYLPWLEEKSGKAVVDIYSGDGVAEHSVSFPVYDSTLLSFLKVAENTKFMDRNYRYVYTRNFLKTVEAEKRFVESADIMKMDQLGGILSNYVLGGRTRSKLWSDGMNTGMFYLTVKKAKELVDFWTNASKTM